MIALSLYQKKKSENRSGWNVSAIIWNRFILTHGFSKSNTNEKYYFYKSRDWYFGYTKLCNRINRSRTIFGNEYGYVWTIIEIGSQEICSTFNSFVRVQGGDRKDRINTFGEMMKKQDLRGSFQINSYPHADFFSSSYRGGNRGRIGEHLFHHALSWSATGVSRKKAVHFEWENSMFRWIGNPLFRKIQPISITCSAEYTEFVVFLSSARKSLILYLYFNSTR